MVENTLGVQHNITKNLENIRKQQKNGGKPSLPILWRHFPWRHFRSHPVVMLLPVMRNGTFCTTTIVKKKRGKKCHFRACAGHTSVTNVTSGNFRSGPLPVTSLPVTTQFLLNHPLKYDLNRTDILLWTSSPRGYHPLNSQRYHLINTSEHLILRRHTITCETNTGVGFLSIMHY